MRTAREVKAHAPHCRVIFTVYEMKRLGRDAAELTALADHLTAHGRESTLEGLDTAARKGKHGGRPPVITDDMLHTVLRRRSGGEVPGPRLAVPDRASL
ncbi:MULTISPECIES: hypothetical protein [unclassified Kitasatospora]|uniref:hypothetical protein n=1 Tax=unclassified Kitasatospora TaxID=2633591 RepID=UPI00070A83B3|nr:MULTISPECIES: hypothetical protein [unclassified Kitasatospora]KQV13935.1 hypothetical protein ASC99_32345 [Kitasatospora sp. Root107]KRB68942.1 hypothetical protein ASE03_29030 [Kitasatospora sp. Root187]